MVGPEITKIIGESPMNIYELHWLLKHNPDGSVMNYRKIAQELILMWRGWDTHI